MAVGPCSRRGLWPRYLDISSFWMVELELVVKPVLLALSLLSRCPVARFVSLGCLARCSLCLCYPGRPPVSTVSMDPLSIPARYPLSLVSLDTLFG